MLKSRLLSLPLKALQSQGPTHFKPHAPTAAVHNTHILAKLFYLPFSKLPYASFNRTLAQAPLAQMPFFLHAPSRPSKNPTHSPKESFPKSLVRNNLSSPI